MKKRNLRVSRVRTATSEPPAQNEKGRGKTAEPIAITGIGCRFPGGADSFQG